MENNICIHVKEKPMEKKDSPLWSDKIWESVDDSKQGSTENEVNNKAVNNLNLKQSPFFQSDLLWFLICLLPISLFTFIPSFIGLLACCSIILIILVNVIFWVIDEGDSSRKTRKILLLIVVVAFLTYGGWKVFEANCCGGFSNFN